MSLSFTAGLAQVTAGPDPDKNASINSQMVLDAANAGAEFVFFPEVCNMIEPDRAALRDKVLPESDDATLGALRAAAQKQNVWVLVGSVVVKAEDGSGKLANRSVLIDNTGTVCARYDKMHLFDVNVGTEDTYCESDTYRGGDRLTLAETPWGLVGMTVCYDLRFPHLYRDLAKAGAVMMTIPSAFTRPTGEAHWHVLMRARAIECGAFVIAPAQTGDHAGGRRTYGHSLVVDPWGGVIADAGVEPGVTIASLELDKAASARKQIPALTHDRDYGLVVTE